MSLPPDYWIPSGSFQEILYHKSEEGIAKITINRPHVRNAFTPLTVREMQKALDDARDDINIGTIILTGQGDLAFCSGGDQKIRGDAGYKDQDTGHLRLNVLDFQRQIRTCPKPIVAMVAGYAIGGGHVLHLMCDLTIAAENGVFGQTGPKVGSFDGGYGSSYLARIVGQKKAREIWFLCRQYNAQQALEMGLVNTVVPLEQLEEETVTWCRQMLQHSSTALRCLKAAMNADCDGVFATVMILASVSMIRGGSEPEKEGELQFNYPMIALEGLIVGGVTGFVGAGGGFLIIPALVMLAKLPMKQAVGTSLMIIAVKSLFGFLGDLGNQSFDWGFLALFSLLSIIGIYLGTYLSRFVSSAKLKPGFGWFVLIMGLFILAKETFL